MEHLFTYISIYILSTCVPYQKSREHTCKEAHLRLRKEPYHTVTHWHTHCNTLQHTATHCNTLQHCVFGKSLIKRDMFTYISIYMYIYSLDMCVIPEIKGLKGLTIATSPPYLTSRPPSTPPPLPLPSQVCVCMLCQYA